ncbi:MAG: 2-C-methyl-D-erythritol 2,4-cyclodiphosphate synthase [Acidobacteriota bacterium]
MLKIRSGIGYDIHRLKAGNGLYIGGILVSKELEFVAHSDGDVLIHALTDSLLGAIGESDIGELFPDTDPRYKGKESRFFLENVIGMYKEKNIEIMNIDSIIIAETPKISPFKPEIIDNISSILNIDRDRFNVKAKTREKVDSVGRGEAIESYCISMVRLP